MSHVTTMPIALSALAEGQTARVMDAQLDPEAVGLLRALGLAEFESFRLCKAGEPCILQVGATRIGVSRVVASKILVLPDRPADR